ncbi:MAG: alanine racemase [Blastocatellia bacterium]|nr:alanine racemase [Blastocatellia bacterium]
MENRELESLKNEALDEWQKGIPERVAPSEIRGRRWNLLKGDLPLPLLVIKERALEHNLRRMAEWCNRNGLLLAPHGKTTMCPQIFERQIDHGAWAMTVANTAQAAICRRFGISRIIIANQVVDSESLRRLASMINNGAEIYCLVDSVEGVRRLAQGLDKFGAKVNVLIELGRKGWRAGVRNPEAGMKIYAEATRHQSLEVCGVEAFEGLVSSPGGHYAEARIVDEFLDDLYKMGELLRAELPEDNIPILSAGGSAFLDRILRLARSTTDNYRFVVRSGCYVTHDHQQYQKKQEAWLARSGSEDLPRFIPGLELWGCIQSVPQSDRAILNFGKRDVSYDLGLPQPLFAYTEGKPAGEGRRVKAQITTLNDQHAYLDFDSEDRFEIGELVCCGISHPCTCFDKWQVIPVVDDDYNVIDLYRTFF